jgi:hypothetical protein
MSDRGRHHRRRRRPGRRPPHRLSRRYAGPPGPGFTGYGLRPYHDLLLPGLRGREKRLFLNKASGGLLLGAALAGAVGGFAVGGPLGGLAGLGLGVALGGALAERGGFYRR